VGELSLNGFGSGLVGADLATQGDDLVGGVEEFLKFDGEAVPFRSQPCEDPGGDHVRPYLGIAIRIGTTPGVVPANLRRHRSKSAPGSLHANPS